MKRELKNEKVYLTYNPEKKEFFGRDLTDRFNEPAFYNKTRRGHGKAWEVLQEKWTSEITISGVMDILNNNGIKCHYWCMVD